MTGNYFNALDAGVASENGANVNVAALQHLIDDVQAAGGGTIAIPPGTYAIHGTISLNPAVGSSIEIRGLGGATLVQTAGADAPLFGVGFEDDECGYVVIADLKIQCEPPACAVKSDRQSATS